MNIILSVECDDDSGQDMQEWFTQFAKQTRVGCSIAEYDVEIELTTSDGVRELY